MTDIVDRLRSRYAFFQNGGIWLMSAQSDLDCIEAADEIERLRVERDACAEGMATLHLESERLQERVTKLEMAVRELNPGLDI